MGKENSANLIRGAAGSFIVKFIGAGITLGSQILIARLLGAKSYGNYIYALTWMNILVLFGKLGFDITSLRFVAIYYAQGEWSLLKGFLYYSDRVIFISSFCTAFCFAFGTWLLRDYIDIELLHSFWIASFILPIFSFLQVQQEKLRALRRVVVAQIPEEILLPLLLVLGLIVIAVGWRAKVESTGVMIVNFLASVIAFSAVSLWLKQNLPREITQIPASFNSKGWLETAWTMIFISSFNLILFQADTLMIGAMSGTVSAGIYTVVSKLSSLLVFVLVAVNSILAPMIADLHANNSRKELQHLISLGVQLVFFASLIFASFLIIMGKFILSLFGQDFSAAYLLLIILIVGQLVNAFAGPVGLILNMTGYQNDVFKILGVSTIINIALNAILIPYCGATGAAIATVLTMAFWNITMAFVVWYRLKIITVAIPKKLLSKLI